MKPIIGSNMNAYTEIQLNTMEEAIIAFTNGLYAPGVIDLVTKEEMRDMFSSGQLMSKKWLLEQFANELGDEIDNLGIQSVVVAGGWVGLLARAINSLADWIGVDSLDVDPAATKVAEATLADCRGEAILGDMYEFDYAPYQCVVNTSAEHISDLPRWVNLLKPGTFVVVQSNNARHVPEHVNCVDSADELKALLGLSEVLYADELVFPMYTRFMVIGRK
jgi:hypothetical protein